MQQPAFIKHLATLAELQRKYYSSALQQLDDVGGELKELAITQQALYSSNGL